MEKLSPIVRETTNGVTVNGIHELHELRAGATGYLPGFD